MKVPVPEDVQLTLIELVALPIKLNEAPSQIDGYIPAATTWFGVKFNTIKSETAFVQGATAWAVTVKIIGFPDVNSDALGI